MNINDIYKALETIQLQIKENEISNFKLIGAIVIIILFNWLINYYFSYGKKKAENNATKEDIEEITKKIEGVKSEVSKKNEIQSMKYKMKHDACIESLTLIDALYSHLMISDKKDGKTVKQFATTEEARLCHNKLILSCESIEIIKLFNLIILGPKDSEEKKPPTDLLNDYRNLIRKELGFGSNLILDRDRAWINETSLEYKEVKRTPTILLAK